MAKTVDLLLVAALIGLSYLSGYRARDTMLLPSGPSFAPLTASCNGDNNEVVCTWTNDTGEVLEQNMNGATWR